MSLEEALQILREHFPVPQTNRDDNLSPEQVAIRDAFRVVEETARQMRDGKHYE